MRYRLIAPTREGLYHSIDDATLAMLWAGKDDLQVTCMPYIVRADGSSLTTTENDRIASFMDAIDHDALPPCPETPTNTARHITAQILDLSRWDNDDSTPWTALIRRAWETCRADDMGPSGLLSVLGSLLDYAARGDSIDAVYSDIIPATALSFYIWAVWPASKESTP